MKKIFLLITALFAFAFAEAQPSTQASNVNLSTKSTTSATITWTRGNGNNGCLVVVYPSTNSLVTPPATTTSNYSASGVYGGGHNFGANNYVVYSGTGSSVVVAGLSANTAYYARVYERNYSATKRL